MREVSAPASSESKTNVIESPALFVLGLFHDAEDWAKHVVGRRRTVADDHVLCGELAEFLQRYFIGTLQLHLRTA